MVKRNGLSVPLEVCLHMGESTEKQIAEMQAFRCDILYLSQ